MDGTLSETVEFRGGHGCTAGRVFCGVNVARKLGRGGKNGGKKGKPGQLAWEKNG